MSKATKTDIRSGDIVRVYQKIHTSAEAGKKEGERIQVFEGQVLARKHGSEAGATITVRKEISGIGVERIFPIHSPIIEKIEVVKSGKARRAKLYYLRSATGQRAKIKER
ncbi:MAG TPA: 50S ribosomal protein L19 [Candidatus Paceibacterota bacterium]